MILDRYSALTTAKYFTTLNSWKAATSASVLTLNVDNPDTNSTTGSIEGIFIDTENGNYRHNANSLGLGFMSDDSNAGAY